MNGCQRQQAQHAQAVAPASRLTQPSIPASQQPSISQPLAPHPTPLQPPRPGGQSRCLHRHRCRGCRRTRCAPPDPPPPPAPAPAACACGCGRGWQGRTRDCKEHALGILAAARRKWDALRRPSACNSCFGEVQQGRRQQHKSRSGGTTAARATGRDPPVLGQAGEGHGEAIGPQTPLRRHTLQGGAGGGSKAVG